MLIISLSTPTGKLNGRRTYSETEHVFERTEYRPKDIYIS